MKNKFTKISLLVLSLVLVLGAAFAMSVGATETEPEKPVILSQNINYQGDFAIMYAVDAETVTSGSVTLKVYDKYPEAGVEPVWTKTNGESEFIGGNLNKTVYLFTTPGVSAASMTDNFYVVAVDGEKESEVKRYSVVEYLYERLSTVPTAENGNNPTAKQKTLYNTIIAFGDAAMEVFAESNETPLPALVSTYRFVTVKDGKVDGFKTGAYPVGTVLALTPDASTSIINWTVSAYDKSGAKVGDDLANQTTVTVPNTADATRVAVSFVNLRPGTMTFDEIDPSKTTFDWASYDYLYDFQKVGEPTGAFVIEEGRGTVLKFDTDANGETIKLRNNDKKEAGDNAFEFSFDIKASVNREAVTKYLTCGVTDLTSSTAIREVYWATKHSSNASGGMRFWGTGMATYDTSASIKEGEWFNMRVVVYENDTSLYIYLNHSATPTIEVSDYLGTNTFDSIGNFVLRARSDDCNATFVIDNYFAGYITENSPNPKN